MVRPLSTNRRADLRVFLKALPGAKSAKLTACRGDVNQHPVPDRHATSSACIAGRAIFKQLPEGWKARIVTLEQGNHEVPESGVATIMADEFFNVYDKTGPGMSNYKP